MTQLAADTTGSSTDGRRSEPFGWHLVMDLHDCDQDAISNPDRIRGYVVDLVDNILRMKRYGDAVVEHFGHADPKTSGYTLFQMIETSNVTAHFGEAERRAYFDVFSCAWYDPDAVIAFTLEYFGAKLRHQVFLERR